MLKSIDNSTAPIILTEESVVVGRGPFLGVTDKKVSRHHAEIKQENGELCLTSIHINPCFYQPKDSQEWQVLEKGQSVTIKDGEVFSLLPKTLKYQFLSSIAHSQEENVDSSKIDSVTEETTANITSDHSCTSAASEVKSKDENVKSPLNNKRRLPSWMTAAKDTKSNDSPAKKAKTATVRQKMKRLQKQKTPKKMTGLEYDDEEENGIDEPAASPETNVDEVLGLNGTKHTDEETKEINNKEEDAQLSPAVDDDQQEDKEEDSISKSIADSDKETEDEAHSPVQKDDSKAAESDETNDSGLDNDTQPTTSNAPREKFAYGSSCYRSNPQHRSEMIHPGDDDYHSSEDEADEAKKPECPFGTGCYRKNLQHLQQYKHTRRVAPNRRVKGRPVKFDTGDSDDDEFINDESESSKAESTPNEDSDWTPGKSPDQSQKKKPQRRSQRARKRKVYHDDESDIDDDDYDIMDESD